MIAGQAGASPADRLTAEFRVVTDGYFETMRVPLKAGRLLAPTDRADSARVVVIDEALARAYFGSRSPLGSRLQLCDSTRPPREVVGVVGSVLDDGLDKLPKPTIYVPHSQAPAQVMSLVVRTPLSPAAIVPLVKRAVWAVDPTQPLFNVRRMDDIVAHTVSGPRLASTLLSVFAALALALAAVGMYGVTAYAVQQRTREIGVRVAVGAPRTSIFWMVFGGGMRQAVIGLAIGLAAAALLSHELASLLYGVTPLDPTTAASVSLGFLAIACTANAAPARRAARANPLDALVAS